MKRALVLTFLLFASPVAQADVLVRVVDYPDQVLSYSPVFITVVVENGGREPVLLPASNFSANRYFIETGSTKEDLSELSPYDADVTSTELVWLKPGRSWFFQMEIGRWLPPSGSIVIRAGMRSTGQCLFRPQGGEEFPLKLVFKNRTVQQFECWTGHVVSEPVTIEIVTPDSAVDNEALNYVRSPQFPIGCCLENKFHLRLQFGASQLLERFPTSHYGYAGAFYGWKDSPDLLHKLLELQPSHPLTPYTRFQKALASITSGHGDEVSLQALDISSALKDYLVQEKVGYEKRQKRTASPPPSK